MASYRAYLLEIELDWMMVAGAEDSGVLIVGAGHAGAQAAILLRMNGYRGRVTMIGREADYPYERPPLSKDFLSRERAFDRLLLRPQAFWQDKEIELGLGRHVVRIDPGAKTVALDDGQTLAYGKLIWATGGEPRRLSCPGSALSGLHVVRTRSDVEALMAHLDAGARQALIVGGGYIGLEAASVLRKLGIDVTLVEASSRLLARVAGVDLASFFEREHRAHGVDVRLGTTVTSFMGEDGGVATALLSDGMMLKTDVVIVGIGIEPSVAPLIAAGAIGTNGVDVDDICRTSLPDVFAIGDCAAFHCAYGPGTRMRVESVQNANDMAACVASAIGGQATGYHVVPWFWSNQYDLRLQSVGISTGYDRAVVRGDIAARAFSVIYLREGRVIAIDCVNSVKDYAQGRRLVEAGARIPPDVLADATVAFKEMELKD